MFRYGGPIKEGVMSGIREPKKDGGMLLVGEHPKEFRDAGGREKHLAPLVVGAGMGIARLAPLALRGARAVRNIFARPTAFQGPTGTVTQGGLNVARTKGRIPGASGSYSPINITRSPSTITGSGAPMTQTGLKPTGFGSYLEGTMTGSALKGLYKGATSAKAAGVTQKIGKGVWKVAKDPLTIASAAYYFYPDGTPKSDEELEMQGPPPPGGVDKLLTDTGQTKGGGVELTPEQLRQKKVDRYRDIMDIKGMNKDAAYNSLIAASQAINQSGDFKGDIKSGKLINQIIQSTSKAFDKPKQTKDAIDTLILKGEIEKDIKASDPAAKQKARLTEKQIAIADKSLAGDSFSDIITERYKKGKVPRGNELAGILRATEGVDVTTIDSTKIPSGVDPQTFFEAQIKESKTPVAPGYYVISDRVLIVDEQGNVTPLL